MEDPLWYGAPFRLLQICSHFGTAMVSLINHVDLAGGRGVCQMSILLHKHYIVKWSTKGERGPKSQNFCPHVLWMTPCYERFACSSFSCFLTKYVTNYGKIWLLKLPLLVKRVLKSCHLLWKCAFLLAKISFENDGMQCIPSFTTLIKV